jgi:hypothetical protein
MMYRPFDHFVKTFKRFQSTIVGCVRGYDTTSLDTIADVRQSYDHVDSEPDDDEPMLVQSGLLPGALPGAPQVALAALPPVGCVGSPPSSPPRSVRPLAVPAAAPSSAQPTPHSTRAKGSAFSIWPQKSNRKERKMSADKGGSIEA